MQIGIGGKAGNTWGAYAIDADGGGADVYNPIDAIFTAANYLCQNGADRGANVAGAIFAYNHASWYVTKVLAYASTYASSQGLPPGAPAEDVAAAMTASRTALTSSRPAYKSGGLLGAHGPGVAGPARRWVLSAGSTSTNERAWAWMTAEKVWLGRSASTPSSTPRKGKASSSTLPIEGGRLTGSSPPAKRVPASPGTGRRTSPR
jgi:hypothetical protein